MGQFFITHIETHCTNLTDDFLNYRDNILASQIIGFSNTKLSSNVTDIYSENCHGEVYNCGNLDSDIHLLLSKLKIKNVNRLIIGLLNINLFPN